MVVNEAGSGTLLFAEAAMSTRQKMAVPERVASIEVFCLAMRGQVIRIAIVPLYPSILSVPQGRTEQRPFYGVDALEPSALAHRTAYLLIAWTEAPIGPYPRMSGRNQS